MGSLFRNCILDHVFYKKVLTTSVFFSMTLVSSLHAEPIQFMSIFERIEKGDTSSIQMLLSKMKNSKTKPYQSKKLLEEFLSEFNSRYQTSYTKEDWKNITLYNLQMIDASLTREFLILDGLDSLLGLNQDLFKNCGYIPGENGQVDDSLALGLAGLLVSGLVGTLGFVFPPCFGAAGVIATASLYELKEGLQNQSAANNTNPNPHPGSFNLELNDSQKWPSVI